MEESLSNLLWLLFKFKLLRKEAGDKRWKPNIYDFPQTLTIASTLSFRKVQGIAVTTAKNICCSSNWNASRWGRGSEWAENRKLIKETSETAIRRELSKNLRRQGWEEHAADLRSDLRSKNIHTAAFALRVFSLSLPPLFLPLNFPTFHLCFPFYLWTFHLWTRIHPDFNSDHHQHQAARLAGGGVVDWWLAWEHASKSKEAGNVSLLKYLIETFQLFF